MISVMCCGCLRLLGKDGAMLGARSQNGGRIDVAELIERFKNFEGMAFTGTPQEADFVALANGWQVRTSSGKPDHRCPDCIEEDPETERSGGYFDWEKMEVV
jgi:hypothetical protein